MSICLRAFGEQLSQGEQVAFAAELTAKGETSGITKSGSGTSGEYVTLSFGKQEAGSYTLRVSGKSASQSDAMEVQLEVVEAAMEGDCVSGTIDVLDVRFGSLWTNIPRELFLRLGIRHGSRVEVTITNDTRTLYKNIMAYARSFADVNVGEPLLYVNSLDCVAVAINQGSFSKAYNIGTGITLPFTPPR